MDQPIEHTNQKRIQRAFWPIQLCGQLMKRPYRFSSQLFHDLCSTQLVRRNSCSELAGHCEGRHAILSHDPSAQRGFIQRTYLSSMAVPTFKPQNWVAVESLGETIFCNVPIAKADVNLNDHVTLPFEQCIRDQSSG